MSESATTRFVTAVILAAIVASAIVAVVAPGFDRESVTAAAFFALLGVLAHALAYQLPRGVYGNISFIPFLSAVAVSPSLPVVFSITLAVLLAEVMTRRERLKAAFNVGQYTLSAALAIIVFRGMGGSPMGGDAPRQLLPFVLAFIVFFLTNTICVSGVVAVSKGQRFLQVWRQNTQGAIVYDVAAMPVVYGFAYVYAKDPTYALGLALPVFGLRQLYKTNWQLERVNEELLQLMVAAIEARDPYTSGHSQRVSHYSQIVARAAGLSSRSIDRVATAALLHDVGKIHEEFAPILRKPGRLTDDEFAIMRTHSEKGEILVAKVSQFKDLLPAIRGHHEAWDGTGYPDCLRGEQIPVWARVITLADTIDAMTTDRPYREALGPVSVRDEILRESGRQFDPAICDRLARSQMWDEMAKAIRDMAPGPVTALAREIAPIEWPTGPKRVVGRR
jgi:HD-GYP domain-containing protein (c-di-GMP phosphodiesterase class II)